MKVTNPTQVEVISSVRRISMSEAYTIVFQPHEWEKLIHCGKARSDDSKVWSGAPYGNGFVLTDFTDYRVVVSDYKYNLLRGEDLS